MRTVTLSIVDWVKLCPTSKFWCSSLIFLGLSLMKARCLSNFPLAPSVKASAWRSLKFNREYFLTKQQ